MNDQVMTLRQHRMSQGLTIRALVEKVKDSTPPEKMSTQTIVSIENGKPARIESFRKLAQALGVEMMEIREYRDLVMGEAVRVDR